MNLLREVSEWGKLYMNGKISLETYEAACGSIRACITAERLRVGV